MEKWVGRTAIVTGASYGIGSAIAKALAEAGMVVVATARSLDKIQKLASGFKGKGKVVAFKCDVAKDSDIEELFRFTCANYGGVDVLVNNAAILPLGTITDCRGRGVPVADLADTVNVNLTSVIKTTRLAAADMSKRDVLGHIFMLNSVAGHCIPNVMEKDEPAKMGVYSATKHAITALTRSIRLELGATKQRIRITSVSPGAVDTSMLRNIPGIPVTDDFPILKCEDIADGIVYVLSTPERVNISEITIQPLGEVY